MSLNSHSATPSMHDFLMAMTLQAHRGLDGVDGLFKITSS